MEPNLVKQLFQSRLDGLRGHTVTRVFLDQWSCGFITDDNLFVMLEGRWSLFDGNGTRIDGELPLENRNEFILWRACGSKVNNVELTPEPENTLRIIFDNGLKLEAYSGNGYTDWDLTTPAFGLFSDGEVHLHGFRDAGCKTLIGRVDSPRGFRSL